MLTVDGQLIPEREMHRYSLMFCVSGDGFCTPVLYLHGRRVTKAWKLELSADIPEDPHGGNANTSG